MNNVKVLARSLLLLLLMLLSAGMAAAVRPTTRLADERPPIVLDKVVPSAFGDWRELPSMGNLIVNPQQQQLLDEIYAETLSRTYVNRAGYRVMLSIAYGKNQSDALQLHKPEVCYRAQGFALHKMRPGEIRLAGGSVVATRLETSLLQRFEPVTYWVVVGDHVTNGVLDKKFVELSYGLRGKIPDGMLVRISSIDPSADVAYLIQRDFAVEMIRAIAPENRRRFAGSYAE